jgi:hypothetical protein
MAGAQHAVARRLADQGVTEHVRVDGAGLAALLDQQVGRDERVQPPAQLRIAEPAQRRQQLGVEAPPDRRRGLRDGARIRIAVQARHQAAVQRVRDDALDPVGARDHQRPRHLLDEQRDAVRLRGDQVHERRIERLVGRAVDQLASILRAETVERERLDALGDLGLRQTRGGHEQQRDVVGRVEQPADQLTRRRVGPVQVLDDQQQRRAARLGVQPVRERVERHRAAALRAQRLGLAAGDRQVEQPGEQLDAQRPELLVTGQRGLDRPPALGVVAAEPPALAQRVDERVQRAGAAVLAALQVQRLQVRGEAMDEVVDQPRLADPRLAGEQDPGARAGARPVGGRAEDRALGLAADQRDQARGALGLEAGDVAARGEHPEELDRLLDALELAGAQGLEVEVTGYELPDRGGDGDVAGSGDALDAGGDVRGLAERLPAGRAVVADHDRAAMDADAGLERDAVPAGDPLAHDGEIAQDLPAAADRAHRVVLLGARVAEVHHRAVALPAGRVAAVALDRGLHALLVGADDLAQLLGIEALAERCRRHQVAGHHRDQPPLGGALGARGVGLHRDEQLARLVAGGAEDLDQLVLERVEIVGRKPVLAGDGGIRDAPAPFQDVERAGDGLLELGHLGVVIHARRGPQHLGHRCAGPVSAARR